MPRWSDHAPAEPNGVALPIKRTPAYKPFVAIVTSEKLIGCDTHFFSGRTMPCNRPNCEACSRGIPYRWHAFLSCQITSSQEHVIFECTAQASDAFRLYQEAYSTIRGCLFKSVRIPQRTNGRVVIQTKPCELDRIQLPDPPDLITCLSILWDLPKDDLSTHGVLKGADRVLKDPEGNGRQDENLKRAKTL